MPKLLKILFSLCSTLVILSLGSIANAELSPAKQKEIENTLQVAVTASTKGPAMIALQDQAKLHIPKGDIFVPQKEAKAFLESMGNGVDSSFLGIVMPMPSKNSQNWAITIQYIDEGYVTDADAKNWNASKLLENLKEGTKEENQDREDHGFPTLEVKGWIQTPEYNSKTHKLVWSIEGANSEGDHFINYNTYALGRQGYFELNLLSDPDSINADKEDAQIILEGLQYNTGKRYEDFIKGSDHLAAYGISALIAGAAAKKLGLLALASVFIIKIWKALLVFVFLFWKRIKNLFISKKLTEEDNTP